MPPIPAHTIPGSPIPGSSIPGSPSQTSPTATATISLPHHTGALTPLSAWVQALAHDHALPARTAFRLELVLVEVVTNVVTYGGESPATAHYGILVQVTPQPDHVLALVEDYGRPFDPTGAPGHRRPTSLEDAPIGGLGLELVRAYTQAMVYRRVGQKNQLHLTLAR